jgi:hypothetical protein
VAHQQQREVVGPVQVVDDEQHGGRRTRRLQQRGGRIERPQLLDFGFGGHRLDEPGYACFECREQPHEVAGVRAQLDAQLVDRAARDVGAKSLRERLRAGGHAVVAAPVQHDARLLSRAVGELGSESRLSDAGFAADQDAAAAARGGVGPSRLDRREFRFAPGEPRAGVDRER